MPEESRAAQETPRHLRRLADLIDAFARADGPPPDRLWPFVAWALRGAFPAVLLTLAVTVAVGATEVGSAFVVGWLIDLAEAKGPAELIPDTWPLLLAAVLFFLFVRPGLMGLGAVLTGVTIGPNLYPLVLSRLNRHTLGQSLSFFDDDFAGRIAQKQQQTARAITEVVSESINTLGFALSAIVGSVALIASVNLWLAAGMLLWIGAYFVLVRRFLPRIRASSTDRAAARAVVTGQVVDTITNIATVKLFSHGLYEDEAALGALAGYRGATIRFGWITASFRTWLMALAGALPVLLIGGALLLWTRGQATPGDIATAGLIATRLAQMSGWVSMTAMGVFSNVGEIEDGMRTLSPPHAITDAPQAVAPQALRGAVDFDHVRFGYGRKTPALADFDLHVRPGERVALVGRSGAGKTTAVSLLLRLYEVEGGRILLDGADIRDLTQDALRAQIGMVRQETAMFNRSAMENIRYGRRDASDEAVVAAARRAEAHDFILGLRDFKGREGYRAHLGERGVKLSGGQRQRIALARVILKNAPVLVLDEATSALDSEVEAAIQDTLDTVMEGKTVIAIAHRLSTIARMDRIVVLDEGRIAEAGTHDALLARGGLYARFWRRQSGGFLDVAAEEPRAAPTGRGGAAPRRGGRNPRPAGPGPPGAARARLRGASSPAIPLWAQQGGLGRGLTDARQRLDQALVAAGLAASRARAQAMVAAGVVTIDGAPADKPSARVAATARLAVLRDPLPWVSRGALKLLHALDTFALSPAGAVALDLGASTGGFTEALLARGAAEVWAIDVGHGQLAPGLRADPRVHAIEGLNARDLTQAHVPPPDWIVADLSFIALAKALGPALALAPPGATLVALVKPQFEVGPQRVGKGGVVRDVVAARAAVDGVCAYLAASGWPALGETPSPIPGGDGNAEWLVAARRA